MNPKIAVFTYPFYIGNPDHAAEVSFTAIWLFWWRIGLYCGRHPLSSTLWWM